MRSAVRLFCFLIGMGFQQIPPLLLLVSYYLFLLLVWGFTFSGELKGKVSTFSGKSSQ